MSRPTFNRFLKQLRQKEDGQEKTSSTPTSNESAAKQEATSKQVEQPHAIAGEEFEVAGTKQSKPIANNAKPVASEAPNQPVATKEKVTIAPETGGKGLNQIVLSKKQFGEINSILEKLQVKTKCLAAILSDISGLVIAHKGTMNSNNYSTLSALTAANYAATNQIAELIGEHEGFKMHYHEGPEFNLYVTAAKNQFIFVIVFSKQTTFGMVRVLSSKVVNELSQVLARRDIDDDSQQEEGEVRESLNDTEFEDELTSRLDSVLFGGDQ